MTDLSTNDTSDNFASTAQIVEHALAAHPHVTGLRASKDSVVVNFHPEYVDREDDKIFDYTSESYVAFKEIRVDMEEIGFKFIGAEGDADDEALLFARKA